MQVQRDGPAAPGARALFRQFHDAWYAPVAAWAQARAGTSGVYDAEDLTVATFWKAWQWISGSAGLPTPEVLLHTCLDRAYTDHLRQEYGRNTTDGQRSAGRSTLSLDWTPGDLTALIETLPDRQDVEAVVLDRESVREYLAALPPPARACVRCRHMEGRSVGDTAQLLGMTIDQVKKSTAHGLALLARDLLDPTGGPGRAPAPRRPLAEEGAINA
jgi:DNA-directed RNA polymerase specialized sigma24 family protein